MISERAVSELIRRNRALTGSYIRKVDQEWTAAIERLKKCSCDLNGIVLVAAQGEHKTRRY